MVMEVSLAMESELSDQMQGQTCFSKTQVHCKHVCDVHCMKALNRLLPWTCYLEFLECLASTVQQRHCLHLQKLSKLLLMQV